MPQQTTYTPELADEICRLISEEGLTLRQLVKRPGMPERKVIRCWRMKYPEFQEKFLSACEDRMDGLIDEIVEMADAVPDDGAAVMAARLRIDTRKWIAGKIYPRVYGERTTLATPDGKAVTVQVVKFGGGDSGDHQPAE